MIAEVTEKIGDVKFLGGGVTNVDKGSLFPLSEIQYSETKILVETGAGLLVLPRDKVKLIPSDIDLLTFLEDGSY